MTFAVCICTRDRPLELSNALRSLRRSTLPIAQVVVSDDGTDGRSRTLVRDEFPNVTFVEGPRRGLGANRNAAIGAIDDAITHVALLDDDAAMAPDFLARVDAHLASLAPDRRAIAIVTGLERNRGVLVRPQAVTFFGYQSIAYAPGMKITSLVMNAVVFPRLFFATCGFDENLVYGSDETDISTRAIARGFEIDLLEDAVNDHFPSNVDRAANYRFVTASRIYYNFKRFALVERAYGRALAYAVLCVPHTLRYFARRNAGHALAECARSFALASRYLARYVRLRNDRPPLR